MTWIKHHWLTLLMLLAIVTAPLLTAQAIRSSDEQRDQRQTDSQIEGCVGASRRAAITAAGFQFLYERVGARDNAGDKKSAAYYDGTSMAVVETIPAPPGHVGDPILAETKVDAMPHGKLQITLTDRAAKLQREGCEHRYDVI